LSVAFLRRIVRSHMWLGMSTILVGLVLVGISDILPGNSEKKKHNDMNAVVAGMTHYLYGLVPSSLSLCVCVCVCVIMLL